MQIYRLTYNNKIKDKGQDLSFDQLIVFRNKSARVIKINILIIMTTIPKKYAAKNHLHTTEHKY